MKTYKQFVTEARELDEGLGTVAKVAMKGITKLAKKSFARGLSKNFSNLFSSVINCLYVFISSSTDEVPY